jgi:uncharacterized protein (TIGR02145 family)
MKRKSLLLSVATLLIALISVGQNKTTEKVKQVKIGSQIWMAENLNTSTFSNGSLIPQASNDNEWEKALDSEKPVWCFYEFDTPIGSTYGKLYNWYAVNDSRGLCPKGWHIPSEKDWRVLFDYNGGDAVAGAKLKAAGRWNDESSDATNESGFAALPGGSRYNRNGFDQQEGYKGYYWSSTSLNDGQKNSDGSDASSAWLYELSSGKKNVRKFDAYKSASNSVRCIKD